MKKVYLLNFVALMLIVVSSVGTVDAQQVGNFQIVVSGTELPPIYRAEKLGTRILIPIVPVAQHLSYLIDVDNKLEKVTVQRGGTTVEFLKQTFEIRENGVSVAVVPNTAALSFPADVQQIRLPQEVVSALLNVSIFTDLEKGIIRIEPREGISSKISSRQRRWGINIFDYNYNSSISGNYFAQNLNLRSEGTIGNSIFQTTATLTGLSIHSLTGARNVNFTLERQRGDRFQAGDLRNLTGTDLTLMNTQIRGLSYENSIFNNKAAYAIYGGRSVGTQDLKLNDLFDVRRRRRFDSLNFKTNFFGGRVSYNPNAQKAKQRIVQTDGWSLSAGTAVFSGQGFSGQMVDSTIRYRQKNFNLEGEIAAGNFSDVKKNDLNGTEKINPKGFGTGLILRASYTPWNFLSIQGYYNKFSPNFSSPLRNGGFNDRDSRSVGFVARPFSRLSVGASFSSSQNRLSRGSDAMLKIGSYSFNLAFDPSTKLLPRMSVNTTLTRNPRYGNFSITTANFTREFKNLRPFANYILTQFNKSTSHSIGLGTNIEAGNIGIFQAQTYFSLNKLTGNRNPNVCPSSVGQTSIENCNLDSAAKLAFGGSSTSVDWTPRNLLFRKFQVNLGGGYVKNLDGTKPLIRTNVSFPFLNNQQIRVGYSNSGYGQELQISLSGSLNFWRPKKVRNNVVVSDSEETVSSVIQGRAYLDENFDHKFDPQIDTPLKNIRLLLDNGRVVTSNAEGFYRFDNVAAGEHSLEMQFEDVRANLVPAAGLRQRISVNALSLVETSFRLVKSGMLSGRVWYDQNGDGKFDENEALSNVRVVSGSGRDTFSDVDGTYLLSDLPPGQQTVYIDQRYLPAEVDATDSSLIEEIKSGQTLQNIDFAFKTKKREEREINFVAVP